MSGEKYSQRRDSSNAAERHFASASGCSCGIRPVQMVGFMFGGFLCALDLQSAVVTHIQDQGGKAFVAQQLGQFQDFVWTTVWPHLLRTSARQLLRG